MINFVRIKDVNHKTQIIHIKQIKNIHYLDNNEDPIIIEFGFGVTVVAPKQYLKTVLIALGGIYE